MKIVVGKVEHWRVVMWLSIGLLAGLLLLSIASHVGGANMAPTGDQEQDLYIICPRDGVFHAGEYFGASPYVEVGSSVEPDTVVGRIESMTSYEVTSGIAGTITEMFVTDGQMVYMGQELFAVKPRPEPTE